MALNRPQRMLLHKTVKKGEQYEKSIEQEIEEYEEYRAAD